MIDWLQVAFASGLAAGAVGYGLTGDQTSAVNLGISACLGVTIGWLVKP